MRLALFPAIERPDLLGPSVADALSNWKGAVPLDQIEVAEIDPTLADTAEFCQRYEVSPDVSANCVVVAGKRGDETRYAACVVLATTRADVNGVVRRRLDARKVSFASMDDAVERTAMEYGGITPVGLPDTWPILIDSAVVHTDHVIVGSGIRGSKLWLPGSALAALANAEVIDGLARPVA